MNPFKRFWRSPKNEPAYHPVRAEILAIEDDPEQAEFLCSLLRMQGAVVTRAYNIAATLEILHGPVQFQLCFIDLNLANSSSMEIVRRIKQGRRGTHCVLVSSDIDKIQQCLLWGYIGILRKPFSIASIREVLQAHRLPCSD